MIKNYSIVTAPNSVLYDKALRVKNFGTKLTQLVQKMIPIMRNADGMGLAAPQIGESLRVAIIEYVPKDDEKRAHKPIPLTILVNPKIIWHSQTENIAEEGCLSLPGTNLDISRYNKITVLYQDTHGTRHRIKAVNLVSRMIQHEVDHLNGILITDRHDASVNKNNIVNDK